MFEKKTTSINKDEHVHDWEVLLLLLVFSSRSSTLFVPTPPFSVLFFRVH